MHQRLRQLIWLLAASVAVAACSSSTNGIAVVDGDVVDSDVVDSDDEVVVTLHGDELALFAASGTPRLVWFWGPY